jgi:AGCS family alanine or glycine:cation symporter
MSNFSAYLQLVRDWIWSWPTIIFVIGVGVICTVAYRFIQMRYFITIWRYLLTPEDHEHATKKNVDMTPIQAFINTLSANLGNGSLAGVATALYAGGPGAAFWMVVIGMLLASIRFAEVFLSIDTAKEKTHKISLGGPMLYLRDVPGGATLAYLYGCGVMLFSFILGNALQTNSIRISAEQTWGVSPITVAILSSLFILYIVCGGSARIVRASEYIMPLKVGTFFISSFIILTYHYQHLWQALNLIVISGLHPQALAGGLFGFTVQQAMRYGISRSIFATESGLGTAAILFSSTGSKEPVKDAIIAMLSTFISTLACFLVALCIVASGVWNNGMTSTALTISAYETVFGSLGGWIVSFLSISFGIGVLVAFAYITREAWLFVTGGRFAALFTVMYCLVAFVGALVNVETVFTFGDIINAFILIINLFGILWLVPKTKRAITLFELSHD